MPERTVVGKLLFLARLIDCQERDYAACYGSDGEPFPSGCEEMMRKLIDCCNNWQRNDKQEMICGGEKCPTVD